MPKIYKNNVSYVGSPSSAENVSFDPSTSSATATNVQDAVKELYDKKDSTTVMDATDILNFLNSYTGPVEVSPSGFVADIELPGYPVLQSTEGWVSDGSAIVERSYLVGGDIIFSATFNPYCQYKYTAHYAESISGGYEAPDLEVLPARNYDRTGAIFVPSIYSTSGSRRITIRFDLYGSAFKDSTDSNAANWSTISNVTFKDIQGIMPIFI